jgi:hypothetical protein
LIVLVPPERFDTQALSVCIQSMLETGQAVLWLALASDPDSDQVMRRRLQGLAVAIPGLQFKSGYKLVYCASWLEAIQSVRMKGDRIVCLEGHMARTRWFIQQPIAQILAEKEKLPVDVIHGLDLQKPVFLRNLWRGIFEWALAIAIIVAFFFIQVYISQNTPDILGKVFIILSILVEFGLIARFTSG